jgi:hypothetical protein
MSQLLEAAENYARRGWRVFPLKPNNKKPLTAHGVKDATADPTIIRQWWQRWPNANIGIACGASGLLAIDLDCKDGKDGPTEWRTLAAEFHFAENGTLTNITPSGGRHLLYVMPADGRLGNGQSTLAPGIDTRGDGGYIVAPPSVINGKAYRWEDESAPIIPCPAPVVEALTREESPADTWQIETLADARQPRAPLVWLCDGIVAEGMLQIWFGAPGTLKTMLLMDLAACIASGQSFLTPPQGGAGYRVAQAPVLWLDFDNGKRMTRERFQAFADARALANDAPLYFVSMPEPHLDTGNAQHMAQLAARIMQLGARLVVVDNLGVILGGADENSAEVQGPMQALRWLTELTGAAVIILHHQRKSNGQKSREGETLRGHSSIEAKLDTALLVTRDGASVTVKPTKIRGADVQPFSASFAFEQDVMRELTSARFWPCQPVDYQAEALNIVKDKIRRALSGGPLNTNGVTAKVNAGRNLVIGTLRAMSEDGEIECHPGPRNSQLWSLPSESTDTDTD